MTMTYTLAMASELEPRIAEDGIQDVPLTRARALLTRLIEQVREDGLVSALTVRGRRRAYLVTPEAFATAQSDRRFATAFHEVMQAIPKDERPQQFLELLVKKIDELD